MAIIPVIVAVIVVVHLVKSRVGPLKKPLGESVRALRVIKAPSVDLIPRANGYSIAEAGQVWRAVSEDKGTAVFVHPQLNPGALIPEKAVTELKAWFGQFEGVLNLADDLRPGKPELRMRMREGATGISIDAATVAQQLRAAIQGLTADEVQVGPESYEIDVRLSDKDRSSLEDVENFKVVSSDGRQVPLRAVVEWNMGTGWARIARFDGMRAVSLRGDVDTRLVNTNELMNLFRGTYLNSFTEKYPDLYLVITGELEETNTTRKSLFGAMGLGLIGVFILLSFQFRTYTEPLIVMVAAPFAFIGVVWGHALMGVPISMPSLLGFIALAGVKDRYELNHPS